jgi:polar amino acid transport system substrate-binding protein
MAKHTLVALVVASLIGAGGAKAGETVKAEYVEWAPFTSSAADRGGLAIAIASAALAKSGVELVATPAPWARVLEDVKAGAIDAAICQWFSEQHAKENILSDAIVDNRIVIIKKAGDPADYNGVASLAGKKVAVVKGYSYDPEFDKAASFQKDDAATLIGNLKKVATGRDDLTVEDEIVARYTLSKEAPELAAKLAFAPTALSKNTCHVAFSRATKRGEELNQKFNAGLKAIKADGSFDAIMKSFHAS